MSAGNYELFSSEAEQKGIKLEIFIVSDFTGETAESVARAALRQFDRHCVALRRFRTIDTVEKVLNVCWLAKENQALIICTLVSQPVREALMRHAADLKLKVVDLFGPILGAISERLGTEPAGMPGNQHKLDEAYFRRVKAIEFSSTCDDGANPNLLPEAELVIVGVSRTCKTPLSMYLANKGIRTANVPLVPELTPPEELFSLPEGRVLGLSIQPATLQKIRRDRLQMIGLNPEKASYAQQQRVELELAYAQGIMKKLGAKVVDVTGRALEETAQEVLDYLREQGCPAVQD